MQGHLNVKYIREFVKTKSVVFIIIRHLCETPNFAIILIEYASYKDYIP